MFIKPLMFMMSHLAINGSTLTYNRVTVGNVAEVGVASFYRSIYPTWLTHITTYSRTSPAGSSGSAETASTRSPTPGRPGSSPPATTSCSRASFIDALLPYYL